MGTRIVLIGAGSAMFGLGTIGDVLKSKTLENSTLVLHDIKRDMLWQVEKLAKHFIEMHDLSYDVVATTNREEALQGADFVIISIEVGNRFKLWEQDWHVPLHYGIHQVYGANGGPGGLFHTLRIVPPILEICKDVLAICPDALVINLSNPMTRISHAITTLLPDLHYIGLCHEVSSLVEHLPVMLETPAENLHLRAGGFNHFSVLVEARYKDTGQDAYPDILERGPVYFAKAEAYYGNIGERSLFLEVLKRYHVLPITTDSHLGEFIPWAQDVADHEAILYFYNRHKKEMQSHRELPLHLLEQGSSTNHESWHIVPVIEGILNDTGHEELAVNVRNDGFISCLPDTQVVEVPATVDKDGVHGIKLETYPAAFAGLLMNQVAVNNLTTEAIVRGTKEAVIQAMLADPLVTSPNAAEKVVETMLHLQEPYLTHIH